ncbi:glucosamine-6-phosphate deaminase [Domibacillus robiginosus]|uniref:glucosamine-6-phosphate deaminase n=1 Tax=Domibacillus robiginosus TaxID=1071054 RepID=UPI00067AAB2F|nr:glucosamine-6-phosphate deaminase [Domibacillus robiginosus]
MNVIRVPDYEAMSKRAADFLTARIKELPSPVIGLATGSTPKGMYKQLIHACRMEKISFRHVTTFNLDEYIGLPASDPNSYHSFMRKTFFQHMDIPPEQIYIPDGEAVLLENECTRYESLIDKKGVDVQVLGIGQNGHIGFNEPGTPFDQTTHVTTLTDSTRQANARFFSSIESVPKQAITMGIASIMKSREILLLASGPHKAEAVARLFSGNVLEAFPASVLQDHPHVTIIVDDEAFSLVSRKEEKYD